MKARILIVDDEEALCAGLAKLLAIDGFEVDCSGSGEAAIEKIESGDYNLIYLDYMLPGIDGLEVLRRMNALHITTPVVFMTAHGDDETGLDALKLGAREFLFKPCNARNLRFKAFLWLRHGLAETGALRSDSQKTSHDMFHSDGLKSVAGLVNSVAAANIPVLICGETGTGKELVAMSIIHHQDNPRNAAPWVALNCAAVPEPLMESELFGHKKGAFTGAASDKEGFFETVRDGTLFLDELSSASLQLQSRLLRVLENGEYFRVGDTAPRKTSARIIAATNRDLESEIDAGRFREDLYHRLCVVRIDIPPLRERPADIRHLTDYFLDMFNRENSKGIRIDRRAIIALNDYHWPGNVRELKHLIQALVVTARRDVIDIEDLPPRISANKAAARVVSYSDMKSGVEELVARYEQDYLRDLITAANGNVSQAARLAGISREYLTRKLKAHAISHYTHE